MAKNVEFICRGLTSYENARDASKDCAEAFVKDGITMMAYFCTVCGKYHLRVEEGKK